MLQKYCISLSFCLNIFIVALARQYATDLPTLQTALRKHGVTIVDIPKYQQHTVRGNVKPLLVTPCDLLTFQHNIQQNGQQITTEKDSKPLIPPLNVNPECACFHYRRISWSPQRWTHIDHTSPDKSYDFEMIYLQLEERPVMIFEALTDVDHLTTCF